MSELEELETEVQLEREALASSLDRLTASLSPQKIADDMKDAVGDYGGEIGRQAVNAARQNPLAVSLVGAGLLLLMTGPGTERRGAQIEEDGFDARVARADDAIKRNMTGEVRPRPSSSSLRKAIDAGISGLPVSAQRKVRKARLAAIAAQERLEKTTSRAAGRAVNAAQQQPLAMGGLAAALGAVVASLLPGTRREDELLGARRDALMAEAEMVLHEEMRKMRAAAEAAYEEGVRPKAQRA